MEISTLFTQDFQAINQSKVHSGSVVYLLSMNKLFPIGVTFYLTLSNNKDNNTHLKVKHNEMFIVFLSNMEQMILLRIKHFATLRIIHWRAHSPQVIKAIFVKSDFFCVLVIFLDLFFIKNVKYFILQTENYMVKIKITEYF